MKKYKWLVPTLYIIFLMLPIYWLINMSFKTTTEIINTYSLLAKIYIRKLCKNIYGQHLVYGLCKFNYIYSI